MPTFCVATMNGVTAMTKLFSIFISASLLILAPQTPSFAEDAPRIKGIGWLVLRSHDRDRLEAFYRALGFQEWASSDRIIGLHAGGGAALELARLDPDVPKNPPRTTKEDASATVIFGTDNVAEVIERARANGATFIEMWDNPANIPLVYIGDPDGNVIGFAEDGPMWGNMEELEALGIEPTPEQ